MFITYVTEVSNTEYNGKKGGHILKSQSPDGKWGFNV